MHTANEVVSEAWPVLMPMKYEINTPPRTPFEKPWPINHA
jgi:hypothetical protein